MTATLVPKQAQGLRFFRYLSMSLGVVICASALLLTLNFAAVVPMGVWVLAAIFLSAWLFHVKET